MEYPGQHAWRQVESAVRGYQYPWIQQYDFPNPGPLGQSMVYAGHGLPPRRGEDRPGLSAWGRLAKGQPLGKKTVLVYNANDTSQQSSQVTILKIEGDDMDAQQVMVTLAPPLVIPLTFAHELYLNGTQRLTGEQSNLQNVGNFPGTATPVLWPPFDAIVEWGVGGASARASVDFVNGATIQNLTASWVRVHAVVPKDTPVTGTSAAYVLYAFVGPGPGVGSARRTVWVGNVNNGAESAAFAVPRFARTAYVVSADGAATPAATSATLRFWQDAGKNSCVGNFVIAGGQPLPFDVPNGAMFASVLSSMGVAARFGIVYHLSI